jgi:hypothetical protein
MPVWKTFGCSAFAACTAEIVTLPIDTAKVRLQIQHAPVAGMQPKYRGMIGTMGTIAKEEGAAALWAGLTPGLHRCAPRPAARPLRMIACASQQQLWCDSRARACVRISVHALARAECCARGGLCVCSIADARMQAYRQPR